MKTDLQFEVKMSTQDKLQIVISEVKRCRDQSLFDNENHAFCLDCLAYRLQ